jgi:excisionase family DNA binding protein
MPRSGRGADLRPYTAVAAGPLLSPEELSNFLGVPVATIYRWRSRGEGPSGFKVGRHVRFSLDDVQDWLDTRRDERAEAAV